MTDDQARRLNSVFTAIAITGAVRTREEHERQMSDLKRENRILRALHDSYVVQRARTDLKLPAPSETSKETYTDADLVRAMRTFQDDIRKVAAFLNVGKGSVYNRLRGLPPGMIDGPEARKPATYERDPMMRMEPEEK